METKTTAPEPMTHEAKTAADKPKADEKKKLTAADLKNAVANLRVGEVVTMEQKALLEEIAEALGGGK